VKSHPGTAWRSHTRPHKLSRVHLVDQQGDLFIHSFGHGTPRPGAKNKSQSQSQERTPSVLSLSLSGKGKPKRPIQLPCTWRLPISTLGIPRSRVRFAFERWSDPSPLDSSVGRGTEMIPGSNRERLVLTHLCIVQTQRGTVKTAILLIFVTYASKGVQIRPQNRNPTPTDGEPTDMPHPPSIISHPRRGWDIPPRGPVGLQIISEHLDRVLAPLYPAKQVNATRPNFPESHRRVGRPPFASRVS
jgi:hypothetical protein